MYTYTIEFQAQATPPSYVLRFTREDGEKFIRVIPNADVTADEIKKIVLDEIISHETALENAAEETAKKDAEMAPILQKVKTVMESFVNATVEVSKEDIEAAR